jgi:tRNA(Ile2) C34 agmatinyltransferase TiaS
MILVTCPSCGGETAVKSEKNRDCEDCGEEVPMAVIEEKVKLLESSGVPAEPTERP